MPVLKNQKLNLIQFKEYFFNCFIFKSVLPRTTGVALPLINTSFGRFSNFLPLKMIRTRDQSMDSRWLAAPSVLLDKPNGANHSKQYKNDLRWDEISMICGQTCYARKLRLWSRTWLENTPYYHPRVIIYERKMFIRLAPGVWSKTKNVNMGKSFLPYSYPNEMGTSKLRHMLLRL